MEREPHKTVARRTSIPWTQELEKQAKQVPPTRLPMEINYGYGNEGNPKDLSPASTTAQKGWEWEASQ